LKRQAKLVSRPKSLSKAAVVDAIRQGVLVGDLVPGQRLVEAELCELLRASRGTVRAALMDLAHEGLVERVENRGARVRVVSLQEALQIVEVRFAVETLMVARAAERITNRDVARLRSLAKQLKEQSDHGNVTGFAELTHRVFEDYCRIADQPVAKEILNRLRACNTRHRFRLTYRPGRAKVALPFWLDIIEAICARDPNAARLALRRHVENVRDAMQALAAEEPTPFGVIYPGADARQST
jgi:DNA-binding GntR family transcriptional regulator